MASAENVVDDSSDIGEDGNNEEVEHVIDKAEICDNILSTHRSMPYKTVTFQSNCALIFSTAYTSYISSLPI